MPALAKTVTILQLVRMNVQASTVPIDRALLQNTQANLSIVKAWVALDQWNCFASDARVNEDSSDHVAVRL
jgi:hypothetical protein